MRAQEDADAKKAAEAMAASQQATAAPGEDAGRVRGNGAERKRLPLVVGQRPLAPGETPPPEFSAPPGGTGSGPIA